MLELFKEARWDELYAFFATGNPPLVLQLLVMNTIVFMVFVLRRMRGVRTLHSETASMVQSLLLFSNMLVIFEKNIRESISWYF